MDEWLPHTTFLKGPGPEVHQKLCHQVQDLQIEEPQLGQKTATLLLLGSRENNFKHDWIWQNWGETWMVFFEHILFRRVFAPLFCTPWGIFLSITPFFGTIFFFNDVLRLPLKIGVSSLFHFEPTTRTLNSKT